MQIAARLTTIPSKLSINTVYFHISRSLFSFLIDNIMEEREERKIEQRKGNRKDSISFQAKFKFKFSLYTRVYYARKAILKILNTARMFLLSSKVYFHIQVLFLTYLYTLFRDEGV
jgi:hypothetical protein